VESIATLKIARLLLPMLSAFIKKFAFCRIAQHLVGWIDFLKFFRRIGLILRRVRVMGAGQLSEGLLDFRRGCGARHSQRLVIVFKLNGHIFIQLWDSPLGFAS